MSLSPGIVKKWITEAREQLTQAEQICNDANTYITLTTTKLTLRDDRLPKMIFYMDSIKQQLRLLGIIRDSLDLSINKLFDKKVDLKTKLDKELSELNKTVTCLKNVNVDEAFNKDKPSLFYYISEDDLLVLLEDVDKTTKQIDELIKNNRTDALLIRMGSDLDNLLNEFNALETNFNVHSKPNGDNSKVKDSVTRLLKINSELEMDLVSILEGFNRHYDQCMKCSEMLNDDSVSLQDLQDLQNALVSDIKELPHAMVYLKGDRDTVVKNCKEIIKSVGIFQTFYDQVESFIKELTEYGNTNLKRQMNDFNVIDTKLTANLEKLDELKKTVINYTQDFNQFIVSYYSLVLEISRRVNANKKLEDLIENFKINICEMINNDYDQRIQFMSLHGDFLPENLVSPQLIKDTPPRVEINLSTEDLPVLAKESIAEALKKI
ncbi:hypothetical protein FOA43_004376 [Brettanomyces nanus]|uniref:Autophagy-related protein 17 n=1 Tax=Eeniella nana TaxID=13502 RepID=A0A875SB51_EENNA|nr:uncharacterized protein FOA43_004376 [Brettanomyces nanus]QPG76982.1 hypothetical protein FOA43_004376 [Brettanomyces nanus]